MQNQLEEDHQRESRLLFSSFQTHLNKWYGEQMPIVEVGLVNTRTGVRDGVEDIALLSDEHKRAMICTASSNCNNPATHISNLAGFEQLCCDRHATETRERYSRNDPSLWFCRELKLKQIADCMWIIVWKLPLALRDAFGLIPWLWYPTPPTTTLHEDESPPHPMSTYRIYRQPDDALALPVGAQWFPINTQETAHLFGQLINENRRGSAPHIIGFAPDEPFDRPDISLGYSVSKHVCPDCVSHLSEPYCFNYKKVEEVQATWSGADVIEFVPQEGIIRRANVVV